MKIFIIGLVFIFLSFLIIITPFVISDYIKYKKIRANKPKYLTSTKSIKDMMPKLQGIKNCYWNGDSYNVDFDKVMVPGPNACWYKGFIFITDKEAARISKTYKWVNVDSGWKPSLDTTPLGTTHNKCKWTESHEYTKSVEISHLTGDIYLDKTHSLLFFDLHTM